jgi:nitrogen regulatory protein P-II 1
MKKIEAIITPFKLQEVIDALHDIGVDEVVVAEVMSFGRRKSRTAIARNAANFVAFLSKMKIAVILDDALLSRAIRAILQSASSDMIGDDKIFVSTIEETIPIRTVKRVPDAV